MAGTGCRRGSGSRLRSGPQGTLPHTSALLCSLSASQVASISWPVLTRGEWRTRPAPSHPRSPLALPRGPREMLSVLRPHSGGHQGLSSFRGWFHNGSCGSSQMTGCGPGSGRRCGFKGRGLLAGPVRAGPKPQFPLAVGGGGRLPWPSPRWASARSGSGCLPATPRGSGSGGACSRHLRWTRWR